ncbi:MAG TPA: CehA/McbA family metallohydrolase [Gemmataceae bacterium]|nr:CehA/McbA family metallohydrolase [Gemmataceae bacterium]
MSQTLNVHVRVIDSATGKPTPVRIRIAGPDGKYLQPMGRPPDFPVARNEDVGGHVYVGGKHYAYIDGGAEFPLPTAVPLSVEISKGPAFTPIRETVTLGEGQLTLRFAICKWAGDQWSDLVAADSRCHFLSPHAAQLEAKAEGIDFVNLLATVQDYPSHDGHMYRTIPNMAAFSGQSAALDGVYVNTFNVHPALGHLSLLNCHRAVFPLTFGHNDETDDWSLSDWCDQCHRKKGLVVWSDAYRSASGLVGGEALINTILGKVDAIEFDALERTSSLLPIWYRLLNAGLRLAPIGGSAKDNNRGVIGSMRTLTPVGDARSYSEWVEHVRGGRAVVTNGPFLRLTVDDQPFQSQFQIKSGQPLRLRAFAESALPFEKLELIANGSTIGASKATGDGIMSAVIEAEHIFAAGGWVAARCWGSTHSAFAHTAPVFIEVDSTPTPRQPTAVAALLREIADVREWIENVGRFTIPKRRDHLLALCDTATEKLTG